MNGSFEEQNGANGCQFVDSGAAFTGNFRYFVVNAAAVVSAIQDEAGNSVLAALNLSGKTIAAGVKITPKTAGFKALTLASEKV